MVTKSRVSLSIDEFAEKLGQGELGQMAQHMDVEKHFYDSISYLIGRVAHDNISTRISGEEEDIVQECFIHIRNNLHKYKSPSSGGAKLTTWVCFVSRNFVRTYYRKTKNYQSNTTNVDIHECEFGGGVVKGPDFLDGYIKAVVEKLFEKYPDKSDILTAMFNVNHDGSYELPSKISCADIAKDINCKYTDVSTFYRRHVTPFFKECFAKEL